MDAICRKCGSPYQAKRRTSKYCRKSCKSAYNQQVKRGQAPANPLTNDEAYLLEIVLEIAELSAAIWAEQQAGATGLSITSFERLGRCARVETLERVKLLKERLEAKKRFEGQRLRSKKKQSPPGNAPEGEADGGVSGNK